MSAARFPRWFRQITLIAATVSLASIGSAQQTHVTRYDAFIGYNLLSSPSISLTQPGFGMQIGFRPATWYSVGFDYTKSAGNLRLTPDLLPVEMQDRLSTQLGQLAAAGRLPAGYQLTVPANSETQTFAVGPQLAYRRLRHATLFFRPVFAGLIRETATPKPPAGDLIAAGIVAQLAPEAKMTDTTWFMGFGGGFDILASKNFAFRVQADLVYDHLFPDVLRSGRWTTRFSVGPAFNFGRNIAGGN